MQLRRLAALERQKIEDEYKEITKTIDGLTTLITQEKAMIKELKNSLKLVLADKGYDSKENRQYCWDNNIEVHIPFRQWNKTRKQQWNIPSKRMLNEKKFDQIKYKKDFIEYTRK